MIFSRNVLRQQRFVWIYVSALCNCALHDNNLCFRTGSSPFAGGGTLMASESFPPSPCHATLSCRDTLLVRVLFVLIIYNTLLHIYVCFVKEQMT